MTSEDNPAADLAFVADLHRTRTVEWVAGKIATSFGVAALATLVGGLIGQGSDQAGPGFGWGAGVGLLLFAIVWSFGKAPMPQLKDYFEDES